ncbi:MAG: PGPGW domain-containing protein [Pirellulales bacterium]|nr:PGPGW domain-containing protein [Pirellulales bacterium]HJN64581.1 PGPGW domain-containing protein [Pirellulales bacterium]
MPEIPTILHWLLVCSVVMFVASLILLPYIVIRLPVDYFTRTAPTQFARQHPLVRLLLLGIKNLLGAILLGGGFIMLFTPGQGILAILIGLALIDLPGAHRLKMSLLARPRVIAALNKVRHLAHREPLLVPLPHASSGAKTDRDKPPSSTPDS